ncbi:MAG: Do family serine endopeptidase [Proteobacteria bacterium]|nr:Do family serine endopeptidase [Pseudomonadota bacterium]
MRLFVLVAVCLLSMSGHAAIPTQMPDGEMPSLAPMLEKVNPSVVNIATYTNVAVRNPLLEDPFFRRFFNVPNGQRYRRTQSAGSGVVVDEALGHIITNHHVVAKADEILVTLSDGRSLPATLIGSDPHVDLAVLKVEAKELRQMEIADSGALRVGDFVVAIGNPFGLNQTVTSGIISALGRSGLGIEGYEDFIQTDASINPGNSGGALVDLRGGLIGINTAIFAPAGGNVGIGFAIPSNMVRAVMDQIIEHGEVRRGYLGIAVQSLNPELAEAFGVERREGVVVLEVEPESIADEAGIRSGDIVTRVGSRQIKRVSDFDSQAAVMFVGDEIEIEVLRDGKAKKLDVEISDTGLKSIAANRLDERLSGVQLQNYRSKDQAAGILITDVDTQSKAWRFGLRTGDIIVSVNQRGTDSIGELREVLRTRSSQILLRVYRAGEFGFIAVR